MRWRKNVLRTCSGDDFNYLPDDVVKKNSLAYELWQQQQGQDQKDLNAPSNLLLKKATQRT